MSDELTVGNENLISSKRAAELSGYAQDYIGQLARKGLIEAKRIGGLWYISLDSLNAYKSHADSFTPRPPQATSSSSENDSTVSLDGRDYISAARAAKLTGYHSDYVGQLARTGKISSRQIGNRWYVDRRSIESHKEEKDALLGAVQSQAVGISAPREEKRPPSLSSEPFFHYRTEGRDLIPKPQNDRFSYKGLYKEYEDVAKPVVIHRSYGKSAQKDRVEEPIEEYETPAGVSTRGLRRTSRKHLVIGLACVASLIAVGGGSFYALQMDTPEVINTAAVTTATTTQPSEGTLHTMLQKADDWFEGLFGRDITYQKTKK